MRKLFFFTVYAIAFATVLSSCNTPQYVGRCDGAEVISKSSKEGKVYGLRWKEEVVLPPSFLFFGEGIGSGTVYFSNDKKVCYLFDNTGVEVLSGRRSIKKKLDFEPVPIVVKGGPFPHQVLGRSAQYYGNMFNFGKYYLFEIADGTWYALFSNAMFQIYGPFKQFFPGCSGYMYQDVKTGKWGAVATQRVRSGDQGLYLITIDEQDLFEPQYDEVIEVVRSAGEHVWFAKKGDVWSSISISVGEDANTTAVKDVAVDQRLLNKVLKMRLRTEAQGRQDGLSTKLVPNQRVGTTEASVAFL